LSDWGFADPHDSPANNMLAVKIATVPPLGTLRLNGTAISANQYVFVTDLNSGRFVYTPPANITGTTSFTFQVQDNGGTANGGIDLDQTPRTMTLQIIMPIEREHFRGTSGVVIALEDV